jgi:hypothetical protein
MKPEYYSEIFEKSTNMKFFKIRPLGAQLFYADGWTDKQADVTS